MNEVVAPFTEGQVYGFIDHLTEHSHGYPLRTRSLLGERMHLELHLAPGFPQDFPNRDFGDPYSLVGGITACVYAHGNNIYHRSTELVLVAHRDFIHLQNEDTGTSMVHTNWCTEDYDPYTVGRYQYPQNYYFDCSNNTLERAFLTI